ncbi:hypothetical protein GTO89_05465 [Heliobacterium gestii]|uniref:Uncharacterized protein n=1 Tax=Heliomicrobium gestii TaxID=2699 RepID=A0A845L8E7_HELGE|nr:hypothetical protein [Heliomicrobium gestii]MBM7866186.1 hypothetical protein [Heliomicrobium gestii]MZP42488.1 hypothetical protein [Heliomicrobium gestii]
MDPKKMEDAMKQMRTKMAEAKNAENKVEIVADAIRDMIVNMGVNIPDKAFDVISKIKIPANLGTGENKPAAPAVPFTVPKAATAAAPVTVTKPPTPVAPVTVTKPPIPAAPVTVTKPPTPVTPVAKTGATTVPVTVTPPPVPTPPVTTTPTYHVEAVQKAMAKIPKKEKTCPNCGHKMTK